MSHQTELGKRVTTGMIGGALLLLMILFGGRLGIAFVTVIISLGMVYEFVEIVFNLPDKAEKRFVLLGITWLISFVNFWIPRVEYTLLVLTFTGLFGYFLFAATRYRGESLQGHFQELMYSIFGAVYLIFLPLFLPLLHDYSHGVDWTVVFLLICWAGDTGAYFIGKRYGRRALYYLISPKKTIEGALGGLAAGVLIAFFYKVLFFRAMPWSGIVIIPLLVGTVSQIGDLCESFLKRAFSKKDSGSVLPGHGGFLDRFDGVVFSLPLMYACARLFS